MAGSPGKPSLPVKTELPGSCSVLLPIAQSFGSAGT
jgi:hypothetical protein